MPVRPILLLGDPRLYQVSEPVAQADVEALLPVAEDLHDTMRDFQKQHGWGRAIAAPQIGVARRLVCVHVDRPLTMFNPVITDRSPETREIWEDCMSFPELLVRLRNPVRCRLTYHDAGWTPREVVLTEDYAELLQHEVDHLDGILSLQRADGERAIVLRRAVPPKPLALRGSFTPLG